MLVKLTFSLDLDRVFSLNMREYPTFNLIISSTISVSSCRVGCEKIPSLKNDQIKNSPINNLMEIQLSNSTLWPEYQSVRLFRYVLVLNLYESSVSQTPNPRRSERYNDHPRGNSSKLFSII